MRLKCRAYRENSDQNLHFLIQFLVHMQVLCAYLAWRYIRFEGILAFPLIACDLELGMIYRGRADGCE